MRARILDESGSIPAKVLADRFNVSITTINRIRRAARGKTLQAQLSGI